MSVLRAFSIEAPVSGCVGPASVRGQDRREGRRAPARGPASREGSGSQACPGATRPFRTSDRYTGSCQRGRRRLLDSSLLVLECGEATSPRAARTRSTQHRCRHCVGPPFQRCEFTPFVWPIPYGIISEAIRNNHVLRRIAPLFPARVLPFPMIGGRVAGSARACDRGDR